MIASAPVMPSANESVRLGVAVGRGVWRHPQPCDWPLASASTPTSRTCPQAQAHKARLAVRSTNPMMRQAPLVSATVSRALDASGVGGREATGFGDRSFAGPVGHFGAISLEGRCRFAETDTPFRPPAFARRGFFFGVTDHSAAVACGAFRCFGSPEQILSMLAKVTFRDDPT